MCQHSHQTGPSNKLQKVNNASSAKNTLPGCNSGYLIRKSVSFGGETIVNPTEKSQTITNSLSVSTDDIPSGVNGVLHLSDATSRTSYATSAAVSGRPVEPVLGQLGEKNGLFPSQLFCLLTGGPSRKI